MEDITSISYKEIVENALFASVEVMSNERIHLRRMRLLICETDL